MKVGIYLRVSTQDQSTDLQRREIEQYVKARGWDDIAIYEDKATGTNGNRPSLKQLLSDARERKVDVLICWKLDRFFRSLKDLISTLQEFNELGVQFISLKDNIDMTTSAGRLMLHIIGAFGEFEASLIQERVRAGLRAAKANGTVLGRPPRIDPRQVIQLRNKGLSLSEIGKQIGATKGAVSKTLSKARNASR